MKSKDYAKLIQESLANNDTKHEELVDTLFKECVSVVSNALSISVTSKKENDGSRFSRLETSFRQALEKWNSVYYRLEQKLPSSKNPLMKDAPIWFILSAQIMKIRDFESVRYSDTKKRQEVMGAVLSIISLMEIAQRILSINLEAVREVERTSLPAENSTLNGSEKFYLRMKVSLKQSFERIFGYPLEILSKEDALALFFFMGGLDPVTAKQFVAENRALVEKARSMI